MMAAVAVHPKRVTPTADVARSCTRSRTPPAAFTWTVGPTVARISFRSSIVAPPGAKPVLVLTKAAPASSLKWQPLIFSS